MKIELQSLVNLHLANKLLTQINLYIYLLYGKLEKLCCAWKLETEILPYLLNEVVLTN